MSEQLKQTAPTLDDLRARRDEILRLAQRYGAYNVRVFGSVARGEATPDSDFDLLVSFREGTSLYELSGLWQDLQDLLQRKVDLTTDNPSPRNQRFMRHVLKEAVDL